MHGDSFEDVLSMLGPSFVLVFYVAELGEEADPV